MTGGTEQGTLFQVRRPLPAYLARSVPSGPAIAKAGPGPSGERPVRRRYRLSRYNRRGEQSVQYWVMKCFAERGFLTSGEILEHADRRVRASAKQRIRDCRLYGVAVTCDQFGNRCLWRVDGSSRRLARRLVAGARGR